MIKTIIHSLYVKGILWVGIGKIINQSAPLLILIIFSKILPLQQIGQISFIITVIVILAVISDFGLTDSTQRFLSHDKKIFGSLLLTNILISFILGIFVFMLDSLTGIFYGYGWLLMIVVMMSVFNMIVMAFNGLLYMREAGIFQILSSLLFISITFVLYFLHNPPVLALLVGRSLSWLVLNMSMVILLKQKNVIQFGLEFPAYVFPFAINAFFLAAVEVGVAQLDLIYVKHFLGDGLAGIYKPANMLGLLPEVIGVLIAAPLLPMLSKRIFLKNEKNVVQGLILLLLVLTSIMFFIVVFALLFRRELLTLFFSPTIARYGFRVFTLTVVSSSFYVISLPLLNYFLAKGESLFIRNMAFLRLFLFTVLVIIGIQKWGINWVAFSFVIVYGLTFFVYLFKFVKENKMTLIYET